MNLIQPLIDKADLLASQLQTLLDDIDGCRKFINRATLKPCPKCESASGVSVTTTQATIDAPQAHGIIIRCCECGLQTTPQHWHASEPSSAYAALYDAYEQWGFRENIRADEQ